MLNYIMIVKYAAKFIMTNKWNESVVMKGISGVRMFMENYIFMNINEGIETKICISPGRCDNERYTFS